jgi:hypothetical protein
VPREERSRLTPGSAFRERMASASLAQDGTISGFSTLRGDAVIHAFIWQKGLCEMR